MNVFRNKFVLYKFYTNPYPLRRFQTILYSNKFTFSNNNKDFQSQLGLKNRTTLLGNVKRFQRRKPKIARILRFHLVFIFFGIISLVLIPGSSLPFQKYFKTGIFHTKSFFNYYWNYQLGKQNEKYVYYLLEDLLAEMSNHQIYSVEQIQKVFNEILRIVQEQEQEVKQNIKFQLQKMDNQCSQEKYISIKSQQKNLNTKNISSNQIKRSISKQGSDLASNNRNQEVKNKKQKLKQKLRKQIQQKQSSQSLKEKEVCEPSIDNKQKHSVVVQNIKDNVKQENKKSLTSINRLKQQNTKLKQPQINLKKIFDKKLIYSPSFCQNILMYMILILQSVIRYELPLLKDQSFYQAYYQMANKFIFNNELDETLQIIQGKTSITQNKQVKEALQREIKFTKILRNSLLTNSRNKPFLNNVEKSLDPHKIITYLINYSYLMNKKLKQNQPQQNKQFKTQKFEQGMQFDQIKNKNILKNILQNYLALITNEKKFKNQKNCLNSFNSQVINNQKKSEIKKFSSKNSIDNTINLNKKTFKQPTFNEQILILAIQNKNFIKSLQKIYIQHKQSQQYNQLQVQQISNKKQSTLKSIPKQTILKTSSDKRQISSIVQKILQTIDQWYLKNQSKLSWIFTS